MSLTKVSYSMIAGADVNVVDLGAVGNNSTDCTAVFTAIEANASIQRVFLPDGVYFTTLTRTQLTKNYYGPGTIRLYSGATQSDFVPGLNENLLVNRYPYIRSPLSSAYTTQRPIIFIGDSITAGVAAYPTGPAYPAIIQQFIGSKLVYPTNTFQNGTDFEYQAIIPSGPFAPGTNGIIGISYVLQPGARLTFGTFFADYFGFWFNGPTSPGKITKSVGGVFVETVNCAGSLDPQAWSGYGQYARPTGSPSAALPVWLDCIDDQVEIVGLFAVPQTPPKSMPIMVQARGGRRTIDFTSDAVIDAVVKQQTDLHPTSGPYPMCVIALGTNDIYGAPLTTPAQYKANLITIVTKLLAKSVIPVLQVPLRSTLNPVGAPTYSFEDYRFAAYEVAKAYRLDICDLSDLDLETHGGMNADRLHPNAVGHQILASKWIDFLNLNSIEPVAFTQNLTLLNGAVSTPGSPTPAVTATNNGTVTFRGVIDVTGHTPGTPIFALPLLCVPFIGRQFLMGTITPFGTARITIDAGGYASIASASAVGYDYVMLDGVSYNIY